MANDTSGIMGWGWFDLFDKYGNVKDHGEFRNIVTQTGDQYYGDRASQSATDITAKTTNAITNANPAVVTTTTAHGFSIGDVVTLAGVTAATADLNGPWAVYSVPSSTTFGIWVGVAPGAVSDAAGTATGKSSMGKITGAKLGTGSTAAAKTGAAAATIATGTYISGSNHALDTNYPTSALSGSSRRIQYKITWAAGEATNSAIREVILTNEAPLTDTYGTQANTICRAVFSSAIDKQADDTLAVTWNHDLLGA